MTKILKIAGISVPVLVLVGIVAVMGFRKSMGETKLVAVDDQLLVIEGGAGNSFILTSEDGSRALVVDTKTGSAA
ncbi:MAG: hypothetical protein JW863_15280 [Chitinispirillaceae bacterium]|nr:hypothetical protein [Chitinispirillaceae bacterium]